MQRIVSNDRTPGPELVDCGNVLGQLNAFRYTCCMSVLVPLVSMIFRVCGLFISSTRFALANITTTSSGMNSDSDWIINELLYGTRIGSTDSV